MRVGRLLVPLVASVTDPDEDANGHGVDARAQCGDDARRAADAEAEDHGAAQADKLNDTAGDEVDARRFGSMRVVRRAGCGRRGPGGAGRREEDDAATVVSRVRRRGAQGDGGRGDGDVGITREIIPADELA